ncbi:MAG: hypothetical protein LQ352_002126 [Teloschistes flavicans]|nr:MAG: hypothetical protein LQ352_002126 [Teloschistes flavicans]
MKLFNLLPRLARRGYRMLPQIDQNVGDTLDRSQPNSSDGDASSHLIRSSWKEPRSYINRETFQGSLVFNLFTFLLPALYGTLDKFWIANIDPSLVVTTDVYTYIGVIVEVLNDGLPRSAWLIIGDKSTRTLSSRLELSCILILVQTILGAVMMVIFISSSERLAGAFVPAEVRHASLKYVQISSVSALSSALQVAVGNCTRALDHPDVPLLIALTTVLINIILDLLIISKFHVGSWTPSIIDQALIRMACDMTAAIVGLIYFLYIAQKMRRQCPEDRRTTAVGKKKRFIAALKVLVPPSTYTFIESALRNALYLWLVSQIVSLGQTYSTAWGVFNTIRWGLVMVPVSALEASTLAFVSHNWGQWRARVGANLTKIKATKKDIMAIAKPGFISCGLALLVEVPICVALSLRGMEGFAYYLSGSSDVASITAKMWQNIDWCYIFYALNYQLSAILLATNPRWYLYQALGSNLLWVLPWAIVVTKIKLSQERAWTFYSVIFGGSLVFSFLIVGVVLLLWASRLLKGRINLSPLVKSAAP